MPNTVQLKRSSTANSVPSAGNLVAGELAINYTDGNLFYKNASNVVTVIASNKFSSVTGNVDAGNIRTTGLISATGNITGGNVIAGAGSGGSITGAVLISASGNIIGGALLTAGITSATGNIQGGNVLTGGLISATGNITGGNGIFTTIVNVASHTGAVVSVTGNITGGNLRTGGLISATGAITGAAITGSSLTVSTGNVTAGNLILSGAIVDSTQLDIQTSAANANIVFTPNGTGIVGVSTALSVTGNITGGNLLTGGLISAAGNIIGGNLGVGATPLNKLYVYSTVNANAATTQANFVDGGSTGGTLYQHRIVVQGKSGAGSIDIGTTDATTAHFNNQACTFITASTLPLMLWQSAAQPIIFATNGSEKARITSGGDFGIGGTPTNTAGYTTLTLNNATNGGFVALSTGGVQKGGLFNAGNNVYLDCNNSAGVLYLRNTATGATSSLDAGGNLSVVGDVIGYASSDKKFKTNIRPIPNALSAVEHIGGKLFDWTDEYMESVGQADGYFRQKEDFGIVAQDVQKVFPLAVRTRPDGSLAVDYVKLSALAFASIAELSAKLKDLEGKINDLTSRT